MTAAQVQPRPWEGRTVLLVHRDAAFVEKCDRAAWSAGLERVGTAASRQDALELIRLHQPDVVLAALPLIDDTGDGGRGFLQDALQARPRMKLIVVSSSEEPRHIRAALSGGAAAYVLDSAQSSDVAWAMQQAFRHTVYLAHVAASAAPPDTLMLTRREYQVLMLVAEGHGNKSIAKWLAISDETVKFHLTNVFAKLGVSNRTEAAREAYRRGLLEAAG
jgi:NarL family two-component system response regulator LiaR